MSIQYKYKPVGYPYYIEYYHVVKIMFSNKSINLSQQNHVILEKEKCDFC